MVGGNVGIQRVICSRWSGSMSEGATRPPAAKKTTRNTPPKKHIAENELAKSLLVLQQTRENVLG